MIKGIIDPRFAAVREAFEQNFNSGDDLGAACAVSLNGELVVDLYGGFKDRKKQKPWTEDTIVTIYSTGKAVLALLVASCVEKGLLNYETKVASYWPEFSQNGKGEINLGQLMSHQAGLCGLPDEMDPALWLDWKAICEKLAAMAPLWAPGTANGYHPQTYGFLVGEVLRRVTGKSVGKLLRDYFNTPYGLNIYCGLAPEELARASAMTKPRSAPDLGAINEFKKAAFLSPWAAPSNVSLVDWAGAELPASNMHADAKSLARLIAAFAREGNFEGTQLFSKKTNTAFGKEYSHGDDLVLPFNISWAAGMMRNTNKVYGPLETSFGHSGFGGSCVFADPKNGLSFAYVLNAMSPHLMGDPRTLKVVDALYQCL